MTPVQIRRRVEWVISLALERLELDVLRDEIYARLAQDEAGGRRDSHAVDELTEYTRQDDRWVARRESLPPELEEAFATAGALVAAAARALAMQRTAGRA